MPTIIDALIVTLSLKADDFSKGRKKVEADQKALRDDSDKTAKTLNENSKKVADGIGEIRDSVIGLFAAFTAGRGLKEFISALTAGDAALGRAAKNIGVSANELSLWQGAAQRAGGTAQGITSSMQNLSQQFQQLQATGQSSVVPYFRALGVGLADSAGKMRPMRDILFDVSDRLSKLDPAKAQFFGKGLGLDEGTINVLIRGRAALSALLDEQEKLGHANAEDARAAQQRQSAFAGLAQASEDLGRKLLTAATPAILAITAALTKFAEWAAQHREIVKAAFIAISAALAVLGASAAVAVAAFLGLSAPVIAVTAAVGAAAAGVSLLADNWKAVKAAFLDFVSFFEPTWKTLTKLVGDFVVAFVSSVVGSTKEAGAAWSKFAADLGNTDIGAFIKKAFSSAFDWIEERARSVWEAITGKKWSSSQSGPSAQPKAVPGATTIPTQGSDVDKLIAMGWTRAQAAGIVANLQRESGGDIGAIGDSGKAYGLGQWHPDRQAAFKSWAGKDIRQSTRDEQLAFVNYELTQGGEKSAGDRLRGATNARDAGEIVSRYYERPADQAGEARLRAAQAAALYGVGTPDAALASGASAAASTSSIVNTSATTSSNSNSVTINGGIQVQTQAKDAEGIAQTIGAQVNKYAGLTAQANYSLGG